MKVALAFTMALLISGCSTSSRHAREDQDKSLQAQLLELRHSLDPSATLAANRVPVLVINGANNSIASSGQGELPVRVAGKNRIVKITSEYSKFGIPVIIAVDASRVREQKYLTDPIVKEVRSGISMSALPNPDYEAARAAVQKAESELRTAQNAAQAMQASGVANAGVVELADNPGLRWAQENYQTATEILNVTKPSILETIYETRKEPAASYVINTSGAIFAYVIDVAGGFARIVKVPVDHEIRSEYVYHHAGQGGNVFETAAMPPPPLELNVEDILRRSEGAPTVALTQIADHLTAGRDFFADETAALERQRSQMTADTLVQLDRIAGNAQAPGAASESSGGAVPGSGQNRE